MDAGPGEKCIEQIIKKQATKISLDHWLLLIKEENND